MRDTVSRSHAPGLSGAGQGPLVGLAPMAGITDWPMRVLCYRMGADYACSEMVSAIGYLCAKPGNPAYRMLLDTHPEEANTACQLFGRDPAVMAEAAAKITDLHRFTAIDLNMGCPARKVTGSGEGSALLKNPDLAYRLMEAVKGATHLPVTLKTRLGYDQESMNALELVRAAESLGLKWAAIHGRTREQQYSGQADYAAIARIKEQVSIPILANGDVFAPADAERILRETGADGLLIGRGAMGNPWLIRGAREVLEGREPSGFSLRERLEMALTHGQLMAQAKGEAHGMVEMRKHLGHYVSGLRGASALRRALSHVAAFDEMERLLTQFLAESEPEEGSL